MTRFLGYLTIGIVEGLLYGLLALGFVLIYKGSRILNFAQTSFALFAAFIAWWFTSQASFLPFAKDTRPRYVLAALIALTAAGLNGWAVEHGVIRRLKGAPRLTLLVATIAVSAGNAGLVLLLFARNEQAANKARSLPSLVTASFSVGTQPVKGADIEILVLVPAICGALALFFTRTRFGVAVRAVAENGDAARLLGVPAALVSTFTWVTGSLLAGIAGLLITEHRGSLDQASISTGFLIYALTAALVGGLTSLPGAVVGGLVVGLLQAVAHFAFAGTDGVADVAVVLAVLIVLVLRPGGLFGKPEATEDRASFVSTQRALPRLLADSVASRSSTGIGVALGMFGLALPYVLGSGTNARLAIIWCYAIVGVSLCVLIGFTGQISLGHWGLVGFGAYVQADLCGRVGLPWLLSLVLSVAAGALLALLLGLPALRIRGLYLAIATLAFHVAAKSFLFRKMGGSTAGVGFNPPKLGPFDLDGPDSSAIAVFSLLGLGLSLLVARNLLTSRSGRALLAVRENEKAAATLGVDLTKAKLLAFAISGGMTGLAGALYATVGAKAEPSTWDVAVSPTLVAMVVIGGLGSLSGSVLGALLVIGLPKLFPDLNPWVVSIGTSSLLFLTVTRLPGGLAGLVATLRLRMIQAIASLDPATAAQLRASTEPAGAAGSPSPGSPSPALTT